MGEGSGPHRAAARPGGESGPTAGAVARVAGQAGPLRRQRPPGAAPAPGGRRAAGRGAALARVPVPGLCRGAQAGLADWEEAPSEAALREAGKGGREAGLKLVSSLQGCSLMSEGRLPPPPAGLAPPLCWPRCWHRQAVN